MGMVVTVILSMRTGRLFEVNTAQGSLCSLHVCKMSGRFLKAEEAGHSETTLVSKVCGVVGPKCPLIWCLSSGLQIILASSLAVSSVFATFMRSHPVPCSRGKMMLS